MEIDMKRVSFLVCVLLLATSPFIFAAGPNFGGCNGKCLKGPITNIDQAKLQIVVKKVVVQVTKSTVIKKQGKVIGFKDLKIGMKVMVSGDMKGKILYAKTIRVCGQCHGGGGSCTKQKIVSIDPLTHQFVLDNKVTVQVTKSTIIKKGCKTITFADLKVGDTVNVDGKMVGGVLVADTVKVCGGGCG